MRTIGLRAENTLLRWVVIEGESDPRSLVDEGKIELGEKLPLSEELVLLRTALLNVLKLHKPRHGAMRTAGRPQGMGAIQSMFTRARLEGVAIEAVGTYGIPIKVGPEQTIRAGMKATKALKNYSTDAEVRGIDITAKGRKNDTFRDAVYAALSVM
jgi:hypothetical protein